MHRIVTSYLAAITLLVSAGCKKDAAARKSLQGTWELRWTGGSWIQLDYAAGNGNLLKLSKNGYEIHKDGAIIESGTYTTKSRGIATGSDCTPEAPAQSGNIIIFSNDPHNIQQAYQFKDNQLETRFGCFALDGGVIRRYEKVAD